ncbi:hypothetical protein FIBSPDRAFT_817673 [Athelia psychrophila]|uniref:Uncharacterized protein n=1 Tax=Athelia psychrophila TaxID=1759441 RepID=A0A166RAT5_9AGAM|nr:hypothetical protein FIBSPDRAFT_817673 [Fibularhizoctonia sp. CBS 109695]
MHEAQRVRAAISMTLCELATASQSPPLECTPFAPPHAEHDSEAEHEHLQPPCVAALSRSPQSWSSYSGYLREIPQLCYAFRRWNDIDTARHIYANITREKIALLQYMRRREERVGDMVDNLTTAQSSTLHQFSVQMKDEMAHARGEWMRVVEEAVDGVIKVAVEKVGHPRLSSTLPRNWP